MDYKVIVMYDSEYKGYVVDVPELNGCMSQGKTFNEALENIKDAIKGWLVVEQKHNRSNSQKIEQLFVGEVSI